MKKNQIRRTMSILLVAFILSVSMHIGLMSIALAPVNLIENPGFETGIWPLASHAKVKELWKQDNTEKHSGEYSLKGCSAPSSEVTYDLSLSQYVAVDSSKNYKFTIWVKTSGIPAAKRASYKIRECKTQSNTGSTWYGGTIGTTGAIKAINGDTDWTQYEVQITGLKTTTKYLRIYCEVTMNGSGTAWFDDASLTEARVVNVLPVKASVTGKVDAGTNVELSCETPNATIYYTTDGSEPSQSSKIYSSGIIINSDTQIKAIAYTSKDESEISTFDYYVLPDGNELIYGDFERSSKSKIWPQVNATSGFEITSEAHSGSKAAVAEGSGQVQRLTDSIALESGTYNVSAWIKTENIKYAEGTTVAQKSTAIKAYLYDELYGVYADEAASDWTYYESQINVAEAKTLSFNIRVESVVTGGKIWFDDVKLIKLDDSQKQQVERVTMTPGSGDVVGGTQVVLSTKTEGTTIYYTLDGSTPTTQSTVYTEPVVINGDTNIKAMATAPDMKDSLIRVCSYSLITDPVVASEGTGYVPEGTVVTLSCATPGAKIYYTTDGSEPNSQSDVYTTGITVDKIMTIRAFAAVPGIKPSAVCDFSYTNDPNLIENGGFEDGPWKLGYQFGSWEIETDSENVHEGEKSFKGPEAKAIGQSWVYVPIDNTAKYKYTVWIKTKDAAGTAIKIRECTSETDTGTWFGKASDQGGVADSSNNIALVTGTTEWSKYSITLRGFSKTTKYLKIYCSVSVGNGISWFDSSSLVKVLPPKPGTVTGSLYASLDDGEVDPNTVITLTAKEENSDIYYTLDGTNPINSPTRLLYSAANGILITENTTLKAMACVEGQEPSEVKTYNYTCTPMIINGNFENNLSGWDVTDNEWVIDNTVSHSGSSSAKAKSKTSDCLLTTKQIRVNPKYKYQFSVWVKTDNILSADGFSINIRQSWESIPGYQLWYNQKIKSLYVSGFSQGWTQYTVTLDAFTNMNVSHITIFARLDGKVLGTAWVDDFELKALQIENDPVAQIECNTEQHQGNIYTDDIRSTIKYSVKLLNNTMAEQNVTVTSDMYDAETNNLISSNSEASTLISLAAKTFSPDISSACFYGTYRLDITVADDAGMFCNTKSYYFSRVLSTPTTSLTDKQREDSGFGAAVHLHAWGYRPKEIVDQAVLAGVTWLRDGLYWNRVELTKGEYTFRPEVDEYYRYAKEKGIKICLTLFGGNTLYGSTSNAYFPETDEEIAGFLNYVDAIVGRYKDSISGVELWNEYNSTNFNPANASPKAYAKVLKGVYERVKAIDNKIDVVCGATSGNDLNWFGDVFSYDALDYCDVVSIHPYCMPSVPEKIEKNVVKLKSLMELFRNIKPIWLTEFGYATFRDSAADFVPDYVYGQSNISSEYIGCDEATGAAHVARIYALMQSGLIDKVFWYDLVNEGCALYNKEYNFGLSRSFNDPTSPLAAKSGLVALNAVNSMINNTVFVENKNIDENLCAYVFRRKSDNVKITMLWLANNIIPGKYLSASIKSTEEDTVTYDVYGNIQLALTANPDKIEITEKPIYVVGDFDITVNGVFNKNNTENNQDNQSNGNEESGIESIFNNDNTTTPLSNDFNNNNDVTNSFDNNLPTDEVAEDPENTVTKRIRKKLLKKNNGGAAEVDADIFKKYLGLIVAAGVALAALIAGVVTLIITKRKKRKQQ